MLGPWSLSDAEIETLIFQTGDERTIFGLDFPFKNADYIRRAMARIRSLRISDAAKENILGKTLAKQLLNTEA